MSMLSAQCDELRTMAAKLVVKGLPEVASVVRDAADTICELRDDLQRTNAENAKLLKELEAEHALAETLGHYHEDAKAENAKLREFATETWELLTCNEPVFVWKGLREKARELGVDDG